MPEPTNEQIGLTGTEGEFANGVLGVLQKIVQEVSSQELGAAPVLFPHGVGIIDMNVVIESQKISFSLKITDATGKQDALSDTSLLMLAAARASADEILKYCVSLDKDDDEVMTDCNAFVKKVGGKFRVTIPDLDADGIVNSFGSEPLVKTTMDPAEAMAWAKDGLVIAGMKTSDLNPKYGTQYHNGHVAVVHGVADPNHPGFPMASWGTLGGRGHADQSIRLSFPTKACIEKAVRFAFASTSN